MVGVLIKGPTNVYCENELVVNNATVLESILCCKHNLIVYHRVRKVVEAGTLPVAEIHTDDNLADLFTKTLPVVSGHGLRGMAKYYQPHSSNK
jgi:hypothetical protein